MIGYIPFPGRNRGTAQDMHIKALFGLRPQDKWPAEGIPPREIQGIVVEVLPLPQPRIDIPGQQRRPRFKLRVMGTCPACQCKFALSRLAQHWPACKQRDNFTEGEG